MNAYKRADSSENSLSLTANRAVTQVTLDNTTYHRNLLQEQLIRMEATYDKLRHCALAHGVDADYGIVMAEITGMLDQAQKVIEIACMLANQLLRPHKRRQRTRWADTREDSNDDAHNASVQPVRGKDPDNVEVPDKKVAETSRRIQPKGTIRYVHPVCDTSGTYCHKEVGRFEATVKRTRKKRSRLSV